MATKKARSTSAKTGKRSVSRKSSTAKKASPPKKGSSSKKAKAGVKPATGRRKASAKKTASETVTVDRRAAGDRRKASDRRSKREPVATERRTVERRAKVNRRRQIDPTTCERDYTCNEVEFMNALDEYKRLSGRMFPTCSEILEVITKLGYEKRSSAEPMAPSAPEFDSQSADEPLSEATSPAS